MRKTLRSAGNLVVALLWAIFACLVCGGLSLAFAAFDSEGTQYFPEIWNRLGGMTTVLVPFVIGLTAAIIVFLLTLLRRSS